MHHPGKDIWIIGGAKLIESTKHLFEQIYLTTFDADFNCDVKLNVLDLLEFIKGTNKLETNSLLTYYINSIKSKTTLYGLSVVPQPNQNVQRNILE